MVPVPQIMEFTVEVMPRSRSWHRATDHGGIMKVIQLGVQFFVPGHLGRFFSPRSSRVLGDRGLWGWR